MGHLVIGKSRRRSERDRGQEECFSHAITLRLWGGKVHKQLRDRERPLRVRLPKVDVVISSSTPSLISLPSS